MVQADFRTVLKRCEVQRRVAGVLFVVVVDLPVFRAIATATRDSPVFAELPLASEDSIASRRVEPLASLNDGVRRHVRGFPSGERDFYRRQIVAAIEHPFVATIGENASWEEWSFD